MAVYTDVAAEDLAAFLADYDLGDCSPTRALPKASRTRTFCSTPRHGYYILTLYEKRVGGKGPAVFPRFDAALHARGITCPQPVNERKGEVLGKVAAGRRRMITFLEGMWMRRPSAGHCDALGETLAKLHLAGIDFTSSRTNTLSVAGWRPLYEQAASARNGVLGTSSTFAAELATANGLATRAAARRHPRRPFPGQRFLSGQRLSGLIDFYFACTDALAYDIAICINAWCFETDHSYNVTKGEPVARVCSRCVRCREARKRAMPLLAVARRCAFC